MSKTEQQHVANPLVVLTKADTGNKVAISGMWIETIEETDDGTMITLQRSGTITVRESFYNVCATFTMHAYRERAKKRGRAS